MNKFQIEELNLYYGQFHALKNINMGLESGGITAFIGTTACCASAWAWFSKSQTPSP